MKESLYQELLGKVEYGEMEKLLVYFSRLNRLTGTAGSRQASGYIIGKLVEYGVSCRQYELDGYFSDPVKSQLTVTGTTERPIPSRPRSFGANCPEGVTAEAIYDRRSAGPKLAKAEERDWYRQFRGKIVVSWNFYEDYVKKIEASGALGLIHIWETGEEAIHEETVGPIWGTPADGDKDSLPTIPVVGITKAEGVRLLEQMDHEPVQARICAWVENRVAAAWLPIAHIPGKSPDFVLVSGHYDSWYEGVTDNAVGNAVCLEMARVFSALAGELERSLVIAWWPGHSNGRYMGSAWYCDQFWTELRSHCVAHLNIDSPGSQGGEIVLPRTTRLEGLGFTAKLIQEHTGRVPAVTLDIPRGADQSFWGVDIPIHLMYKYEPPPAEKKYNCPGSGGGWWWHTEFDTLDKVDARILLRDARLNAATVFQLACSRQLPADFGAYFSRLREVVGAIAGESDPAFDFEPVLAALNGAEGTVVQCLGTPGIDVDKVVKTAGGVLNRLVHSASSPYDYDSTFPAKLFPGLQKVAGIRREALPADEFLFLSTGFIRQRNRIVGELQLLEERLRLLMAEKPY